MRNLPFAFVENPKSVRLWLGIKIRIAMGFTPTENRQSRIIFGVFVDQQDTTVWTAFSVSLTFDLSIRQVIDKGASEEEYKPLWAQYWGNYKKKCLEKQTGVVNDLNVKCDWLLSASSTTTRLYGLVTVLFEKQEKQN